MSSYFIIRDNIISESLFTTRTSYRDKTALAFALYILNYITQRKKLYSKFKVSYLLNNVLLTF